MNSPNQGITAPDVSTVRRVVEEHFPGLWPAVDLGLSTAATLLLNDNANPVAVIYVGGPSSSKTTVADLFADHPLSYVSDNFTPASFVSHAATVKRGDLAQVDLLPRIKHKVLVTPEMAPIFRGKEDDLTQRFAIITRVLDGRGLMTDSGTHGRRGHRGDFLFAWIGCTTPFDAKVWRVMAQLGSRLFFLVMDQEMEVTIEDLMETANGVPYRERLAVVQNVLHPYLTAIFAAHGDVRGVNWDSKADAQPLRKWLARLAVLLAAMRSEPVREGDPERGRYDYTPAKREQPLRAHAVLRNLARGHALIHGRRHLSEDDLSLVARVAISSMPTDAGRVFRALVESANRSLTVKDVQAALGVGHPDTARWLMRDLDRRGVMEFAEEGRGKAACLAFRPEWAWCASPEFRALLLGDAPVKFQGVCAASEPVSAEGVCVSPITNNLVQRQRERERREEGEVSHTPQEMTGCVDGALPGSDPEDMLPGLVEAADRA